MGIETTGFDSAEYLDTAEAVAAYLNVYLEDASPAELRKALATVARSHGVSDLARRSGMSRPGIYKALGEDGNPSFETIRSILSAMGLRLTVEPGEEEGEAAETRPRREQPPHLDRYRILERLRAHEAELKAMGVKRLSLFGSVARGDAGPGSDVDLAAELDHRRGIDLLDFAEINLRLSDLLGTKVDLVSEPARKPDFQAQIDRDRVDAF